MVPRRFLFRAAGAVGFLLLVMASAGCSSSATGGPSAASSSTTPSSDGASSAVEAPFPTLTASSLQPPQQQNQNRPNVTFDPCTWIDDGTISHLGYDPQSRQRVSDIHAEYTFLTCEFNSPDNAYTLTILSGNKTMDEGRSKFTTDGAQIQDATIAGRAAMIVRTKTPDTCDVLLQTKAGYVDFGRMIAAYKFSGPTPERCSGMTDLVQAIVPRIGSN